ncbi:MAG TPA: S-adenosylmethionine decarboxylase [Candidatus Dormibacteraeota bacterium]|jgi:S-adenosylmethionine/arginine decarboxylase-like enzyme|nr:S-adenosylmethionine decarboxylase [Candidatus Dormibacteraeota bacterium]
MTEPFGWELLLDLYECDRQAIQDEAGIRRFVEQLCDEILHMRRVGEPLLLHFGEADPKTAGYSAVQLIETSSVVAHFSEERGSVYLDVFSCRRFDPDQIIRFASRTFQAGRCRSQFVTRH